MEIVVLHIQFCVRRYCFVGKAVVLGCEKLLVRLPASGNFLFDQKFEFCGLNEVKRLSVLQSVENDIWWYYMISMSFYWALTVTQFFDNKRKDFWQMFIHHMITLLLMALSWVCNLHRVGSLVLVVHDCADILLEVKMTATDPQPHRTKLNILFPNLFVSRLLKSQNMQNIKRFAIACLLHSPSSGL